MKTGEKLFHFLASLILDKFYGTVTIRFESGKVTHVDVSLADRYLQFENNKPIWSQRANEFDVWNVLAHAGSFLTCYLELFGEQFGSWSRDTVYECWKVGEQ